MKTGRSVGGWLVGGFVVLTMIVASLVLRNMVSVAASPEDSWVQPVPVPTPPAVHAAKPADADTGGQALAFSQLEPAPVPTPPDGPASPRGQASQATALLLLGLSAFASFCLFLLCLGSGLPADNMVSAVRQAPTACQEG